jgi:hypothetical protein
MAPDDVAVYDAQLRDIDAKLASLSGHIPNTSQLDWREKLVNLALPLDELGVLTVAEKALTSIVELYAGMPEARERIREMFGRYRHVRGALWPREAPTSKERLRPWLLGISMRDVGDNPQEMSALLMHICETAAAAGANPGTMLPSIGAISSPAMRELIVEARGRFPASAT